jgi:hypothetical protein
MGSKPLIESMEKNRSLQTQSKTINSDEEKMKLKFQKWHVHREIWNVEKDICLQKLLKRK